jgi:endonuclease/exonuclease/phosphatase family metal-dependent hydrolase
MAVKVASWNIWVDCDFDALRRTVETIDADIVAMQEVRDGDPTRDVVGYMESLGYASALGLRQLWRRSTDPFYFGPAVFSRLPIITNEVYELAKEEKRFAVRADVRVGTEVLHAFSVHLKHTHQLPSPVQSEQVSDLLALLPQERTIVAGDFNATPGSDIIGAMTQRLYNTDPSNAPTWSVYPEGCPECDPRAVDTRLDYIFASKDLKTSDPRVGMSKASDHLPVIVTVEL